jgi:hypothetical protein
MFLRFRTEPAFSAGEVRSIQMLDVHLPTTDGRKVVLTRYMQPEPELQLLLERLKLELPPQPPPKIMAPTEPPPRRCSADFFGRIVENQRLTHRPSRESAKSG